MPQTKEYLSIQYQVKEEQFETAYTAISGYTLTGIEEGLDTLTFWFLHDHSSDFQQKTVAMLTTVFEQFGVDAILLSAAIIQEKNWNAQWEEQIQPVYVNERIVITPSWKAESVTAPMKIIINPQMSFGTGHHETTRMTAHLLEQTVQPGSFWIDAGTGTGVLAILALKCGAAKVFAFDNDEWSVRNTEENLTLNAIPPDAVQVEQADITTIQLPLCNGITANLHKNLLLKSLPLFHRSLSAHHGDLLISGILRFDTEEVIQAAQNASFTHIQTLSESDWIAIHLKIK